MDEIRVKLQKNGEDFCENVGRGAICIVFKNNEEGDPDHTVRACCMIYGAIGVEDVVAHLASMHNGFKREDGGNKFDEALTTYMLAEILEKAGEKNGD